MLILFRSAFVILYTVVSHSATTSAVRGVFKKKDSSPMSVPASKVRTRILAIGLTSCSGSPDQHAQNMPHKNIPGALDENFIMDEMTLILMNGVRTCFPVV